MTLDNLNTSNMEYLDISDIENIFNIYRDKNDNYFYNLNSSIYFNINQDRLETYICDTDLQWPLISYKIYGTTRLAWFLIKINNIKIADIFKIKHPGDKIKYISKTDIESIIENIHKL